jgi:putative Holliday junction resolvase
VIETRGRCLALDLGERRIGLALSDALGFTAQPLPPFVRVGPRKDLEALAAIVARHDVGRVVVGLPLLLSGEAGEAARGAREFAERLRARLPGVEVELWDERLSTAEAERAMIEGGARRRERQRSIDSVAAALILQGYLDARAARNRP